MQTNNNIFEDIQNQISIIDIIGKVINLKKKGNEFSGICPFHKEKSDSFFVNNTKGLFFCFGCQAKGNMFHFVSKYYNIPLFEAAKKIANEFNLNIRLDAPKQTIPKETFFIMEKVNNFFTLQSTTDEYKKFIKKRNILSSLGYASYNQSLYEYAKKNSIDVNFLYEVGLLSSNHRNIFFNRIMFPIRNYKNHIIGFGGRAINDTIKPKYLHSKESKLFHKKYILYGEDIALQKNHLSIFVVEGYIDCIKMHDSKFPNTVAVLGTSLTIFHINKLWKYTKEIILFFDGDIAGKNALKKTIELTIPYLDMGSKEISAIILKDNIDPDNFLNQYDSQKIDQYKIFIEEIIFILFVDTFNETTIRRSQSDIEKLLQKMQSFSLRKKILFYINKKIYSKKMNISIKPLIQDYYSYNNIELNILIILGVKRFYENINLQIKQKILNNITFSSNYFNTLKELILQNKKIDFLNTESLKILELKNLSAKNKIMIYLKIMLIKKDLAKDSLPYKAKIELFKEMNSLLGLLNENRLL